MQGAASKIGGTLVAAGIIFALSSCAGREKIEELPPAPGGSSSGSTYGSPMPPPMNYDGDARARAEYEEALRQQQASQRSDRGAAAAYAEAKAEWAKAQQRIKDARSGKIAFAAPETNVAAAREVDGNKVPCPEMGGLATPQECASYPTLFKSMQSGVAAFDPPRKMDMGRRYPVKLVIGSKEVAAQVIDSATDAGEVKTVDIKLGAWVCAELMATQFELTGPARQCKERGMSRMLSFDWTVSPKQDGRLKLGVKVESLAEQNGKPLDTIDSRMIAVDVEADAIGRFDMMMSRLTESFGGLRTMLLSLLSALGVLSVIIWRVRHLGQKPDKNALKDLTST